MPVPETEPTQPGHTFKGWYELPETMPAEDVVIRSNWVKNEYNANFYMDLGDTEAFEVVKVPYEESITIPEEEPKKKGGQKLIT